jgi:hypothetical protein
MPGRFRRLSGAGFLCLLMLGIGTWLYWYFPDQPLWTMLAEEDIGGFTADGAHFFTVASGSGFHFDTAHPFLGPVRLRDSRTGALVQSFLAEGQEFKQPTLTKNGRYLAAMTEDDVVHGIDFQEQRTWSFALDKHSQRWILQVDPKGRVLQVSAWPDRNLLLDLPSGTRLPAPDRVSAAFFEEDGRYLRFRRNDVCYLWDVESQKELGPFSWQLARTISPDSRWLLADAGGGAEGVG